MNTPIKAFRIFGISILILIFLACEKDDFCTENPVTPQLVIRFYDKEAVNDLKPVQRLSIIAKSKTDSLITNQNTDSIAIPLNSLKNLTEYRLKMNSQEGTQVTNQVADLSINYTTKEEFISRSCGFRVVFNTVNLNYSGWISGVSTSRIEEISNQNQAHVKIYH